MRRHELDPVSLVFGLLFAGIALTLWLEAPALALLRLRWVLPALGVIVGVALLGSALRTDDPADSPEQDPA